ncbi:MAG: hypothetical protein J0H65_02685 [Rhizobiales bacterium]|nr:hypothetical protein [Hyphomicrobiales bacterium]
MNAQIPVVYAHVLALCASPLVHSYAAAALQQLAVTCGRPLHVLSRLLAVTAERVYGTEEVRKQVSGSFLVEVLEGTVERTLATCKEAELSAPQFVVAFPLLRETLTRAYSLGSQDAALQLLELHTVQGGAYPRGEMAEVLLRVMVLVPRLAERAQAALLRLAPALTGTEHHALLRHGIESALPPVRQAALLALKAMHARALTGDDLTLSHMWLATSDTDEENHALAVQLWAAYNRPLTIQALQTLYSLLKNPDVVIRKLTATAVAAGHKECKVDLSETLLDVFTLYEVRFTLTILFASFATFPHSYSSLTRVQENLPFVDQKVDTFWEMRSGIALLIGACSVVVTQRELPEIFQFLIGTALYDQHEQVRQQLVQAGIDLINAAAASGADLTASVLPIFEKHLEQPSDNEPDTDRIREAVVVFMGGAARSLAATDPKLKVVISKLIEVLHTPSESVQRAVAQYLVSLMSAAKEAQEVDAFINTLLERLRTGKSSTDRRGAAYGLAGVVKGTLR